MAEFPSFSMRTSEDKGTEVYNLFSTDGSVDEVWEAWRTIQSETDPDFPGIDPLATISMNWEGQWSAGHNTTVQQCRMQVVGDARDYGQWIDGDDLTFELYAWAFFGGSTQQWQGEAFRSGVSLDGQKNIGSITGGSGSAPQRRTNTFDRSGFSIKDFIGDSDICHIEMFNGGDMGLFDSVKTKRVRLNGTYIPENGMFI